MKMLPVCSATTSSSSHSQFLLHGGLRSFSLYRRTFEVRSILEDRVVFGLSTGFHLHGVSFKRQAATYLYSKCIESISRLSSMDFNMYPYANVKDEYELSKDCSASVGSLRKSYSVGMRDLKFVENSSTSVGEEELVDFTNQLTENTNILPKPSDPQTIATIDIIPDDPTSVPDSLNVDTDSLSSLKTNVEDSFVGINESINDSFSKAENGLKNSLDTITSSATSALKGANEAIDSTVSKVIAAVDQTKESAGNALGGFSNQSKEASSRVGIIAIDVLRRTIVTLEDSLTQGASVVVHAYGYVKQLLPPEIQNVVVLSEEKAIVILRPVGTAFQQVYIALEGLERNLGLDPSDPILPFVLFVGTSITLWGSYRVLTYGGYAGDLSPKSTFELLNGKDSVILVDVRPEDYRERDGIPDLRRAARFRYANVTLPEVDGSVRKLLKNEKELENILMAAVIRNLKIVQDRSKVVVMDSDGTRSKGIARSLRKLGVKKPYLVQGGFRSWVKEGLRIKELKPETTLTLLNEEAEAILEDLNPPQVLGYGVGFIASAFALFEWEKTLQLIGVLGLAQTIYRRIASYEDSEDFKQDVRLLLAPVILGGEAISWAAGKLETNRVGLPTAPSSSDVQSRVLQAAAKHESQPSDGEETQDPAPESVAPVNENVDLSET